MQLKQVKSWIVLISMCIVTGLCLSDTAIVGAQAGVCPGVLPTRFAVGMQGTATSTPPGQTPLPVRVRIGAGLSTTILIQLRDGDLFNVVGGPVCKDAYLWWQVKTSGGIIGWLAEGDQNSYFVVPQGGVVSNPPTVIPTVIPVIIPKVTAGPTVPGAQVNAMVLSYSGKDATVTTYTPGSVQPAVIKQRVTLPKSAIDSAQYAISPDGSLAAWYSPFNPSVTSLDYGFIGGGGVSGSVPVPPGYDAVDASFSPDSRLMGYVFTNGQTQSWTLGIMDVNSKKRLEFSSQYNALNGRPPSIGFVGVAGILGWRPDNSGLILSSYTPYADGQANHGIFALSFGGLAFDNVQHPFPAAVTLLPREIGLDAKLSPDASKLAYLTVNPSQQPPGYVSFAGPGGDAPPPIGVGLVDATNGAPLGSIQAGNGQGIGDLTWTRDSQQVLFTAGHFNQTYYPVMPQLNTLNATTRQVTSGAALTNDPGMIIRLLACSNAMFFITQPINGGTATLFSAPLPDLRTHSAALTSDTALNFVGCVPG